MAPASGRRREPWRRWGERRSSSARKRRTAGAGHLPDASRGPDGAARAGVSRGGAGAHPRIHGLRELDIRRHTALACALEGDDVETSEPTTAMITVTKNTVGSSQGCPRSQIESDDEDDELEDPAAQRRCRRRRRVPGRLVRADRDQDADRGHRKEHAPISGAEQAAHHAGGRRRPDSRRGSPTTARAPVTIGGPHQGRAQDRGTREADWALIERPPDSGRRRSARGRRACAPRGQEGDDEACGGADDAERDADRGTRPATLAAPRCT